MNFTLSQLFAATLVFLLSIFYALLRNRRRHPFPPGPKTLPLIGNLRNIPFKYQWLAYEKWGREMGMCKFLYRIGGHAHYPYIGSDIIHAELFGTHIIVLNSDKAANELLEKRSSIYSDRCGGFHSLLPGSSPNPYQATTEGLY